MFNASPLIVVQCFATSAFILASSIRASFLVKSDHDGRSAKEKLHDSKEESVLQCAQRCMFISKDAVMKFDESKVNCLCFRSKDKETSKTNEDSYSKLRVFQIRRIKQYKNHALKKPSYQSSSKKGVTTSGKANLANDGDPSTRSRTEENKGEWWVVDMEEIIEIGLIKVILNSWSLKKQFYKDLIFSTRKHQTDSWRRCETFAHPTQLILETSCQHQVSARYVKIMNSYKEPLLLNEVEVYG